MFTANSKAISIELRHTAHNYSSLPAVMTRGLGSELWDVDGKRYLDMMSGYSAVSFGHCHPELVQTLIEQASRLAVTSRACYSDQLGLLSQELTAFTGFDRMLPMNTGAEAVETAIKAARKWGHKVKGIPENRAEIIVAQGNFAGRTTTIISFSSEAQYRDGFGPLTPGFVSVPFGDADALARAISPNTAAVILEPIQGEAGIVVPPQGYLRRVRELTVQHNVLMIADEVQTGLGRTGTNFAFEREGIRPDALLLGKALGGGLLPISAFLATDDVMRVFTPGDHGSTFGGNPLACAVARKSLEILQRDELAKRSETLGSWLLRELKSINHHAITEVRGQGLFIGVALDPRYMTARTFCERMLVNGVLSKDTHHTVVRLAPALTISRAQLEEALATFKTTLEAIPAAQKQRIA